MSKPLLITLLALSLSSCNVAPAERTATPAALAAATATWPMLAVPTLLNFELAQFVDLSVPVVDLKEYGATGDGSTDDSAPMQAAIRAADGGTLYIPPGTYVINSVLLDAQARIRIVGAGEGLTILKHAAGATASMLLSLQTVAQLEVERLTLDGNMHQVGWTPSAIEVRADRLLIQNVEATHTVQQAVRVRTTTYTSVIRNSWFHDLQLHGPQLNQDTRAVQIDHELPSDGDVWLVDNVVEMTTPPSGAGNSIGGFRSSGDFNTRLVVWNNIFRNTGQDMPEVAEYIAPIDIYRDGDGSIIQGNKLYNSYYDSIRVMRSNDVQVLDNVVDGQGLINTDAGAGIHSEGRQPHVPMHGITIRGNIVRNLPDLSAIRGDYDPDGPASDLDISGNSISRTRDGIYLSYIRGRVAVTNNDVERLTRVGRSPLRIVNTDPAAPISLTATGNNFDVGASQSAESAPRPAS